MAAQYAEWGFLVLRRLLPPEVIDAMAGRVNAYIASRGQISRAYDGGYLLAGIRREPALAPLFEWVHTSHKLHAALRRVWHGSGDGSSGGSHGRSVCGSVGSGGDGSSGGSHGRSSSSVGDGGEHGRAEAVGGGYQWVSRNEVSVDREVSWHVDGFGYDAFAPKETVHTLFNVGLYLQDHSTSTSLEVIPGLHPPALGGPRCLAPGRVRTAARTKAESGIYSLRPSKGDAIVWAFSLPHKSGKAGHRRQVEPHVPVKHRSLLTVGYGPVGRYGDGAARAFEFRDAMMYGNSSNPSCTGPWSKCGYKLGAEAAARWKAERGFN